MGSLLVLDGDATAAALDPTEVLAAVRQALVAISRGSLSAPPRIAARAPSGWLGCMPAHVPGLGLAAKLISVFDVPGSAGHSTHLGLVAVFDEHHGRPVAIMEAGRLTAVRTAASATLSLQALAPVDGVLVDETTHRHTQDTIEYREHEPVTAKGKREAVNVWQAVAPRARLGVDIAFRGAARLIGRDHMGSLLRPDGQRQRTRQVVSRERAIQPGFAPRPALGHPGAVHQYRAVVVGCGPRGERHARGLLALPDRFSLVAVCDLDPARGAACARALGVERVYADADALLAAEAPDVLCFATPPAIRLPLVALGAEHGVRAILLEKPLALTLAEAARIVETCRSGGIQLVVCHQLKYGAPWQRVKALVDAGEVGDVHTVHATARPSMLRVGTHLVDAVRWLTGERPARWVLGQAHGTAGYAEDHPCPDHLAGIAAFEGGVRAIVECGVLAPESAPGDFWGDAAVTVHGTVGPGGSGENASRSLIEPPSPRPRFRAL